ncbi:metallophosphoesterase [Thalassoroseus pseudoceratinae]|uniref:metallophosphoesterase n=1 Tax=Thalassoroseus pseudoceratinae TaxID=2713176 RepID=UPI00142004EF|nr:metallophosphoesterase [Thalassoroseus pseudoceratinae]
MSFTSFCVVILLAAGHAELQAVAINRIHGLALPEWVLKFTQRLHDVAIIAFPIALLGMVWLGPSWFQEADFQQAPIGWRVVAGVCGVGLLSLVASSIRWQIRRPASTQISADSRIVDYRTKLGSRCLGNGPHRIIARLPFNEVCQVEFQEQQFHCSRLPTAWDGFSILHLSDFHLIGTLSLDFFREVCAEVNDQPYDLVVFTGDLFDDISHVSWLPETLGKLHGRLGQYFILGNHDERQDSAVIRTAVSDLGWQDVSGRVCELSDRGHRLEIAGTEWPWMSEHPPLSVQSSTGFRILLSHTPDHFQWAQRHDVDVMLSGHNHGGQVILPVIGPVYAPSLQGVKHSAGSWYREPTLMHVSRGLSGEIPLRWNCRPTVTKLVLSSTTTPKVS